MTTKSSRRVAVAIVVLLVSGAAVAYANRLRAERARLARPVSCLRQIGPAATLYTNASATQPADPASEPLWKLLAKGGQVVVLRHAATTPGTGDPPGFKLDDCTTQRNLSDEGKAQARAIGEAFMAHKTPVGRVLSSQYCRCKETAKLAFKSAEDEPALNSAPADREKRDAQVQAVRKLIASAAAGKLNLVLVTHSVNINDVTGLTPDMGEMIVLTPTVDGFKFAGRMKIVP